MGIRGHELVPVTFYREFEPQADTDTGINHVSSNISRGARSERVLNKTSEEEKIVSLNLHCGSLS